MILNDITDVTPVVAETAAMVNQSRSIVSVSGLVQFYEAVTEVTWTVGLAPPLSQGRREFHHRLKS